MGALKNEFSWSHSRSETFRECPLRYYYHYYGYWGGWDATGDPLARRLYVLRNLKNRYLWSGAIVHDVVAGMLERLRAGESGPESGPEPEAEAERAVERMRAEFRESRDGLYLERPKKATGLAEHHYREAVSDGEWRSLAEMVRRSILGFAQSPFRATAEALPGQDWLTLEQLLTFEIEQAKVYVKMDWAYRLPAGGIVICDWKTGKRRPQPGGLQLGCYALYAAQTWQVAPEQIQVIEANINTGATGSAQLAARHIAEARAAITESIHDMRARLRDADRNEARIEDFPAQPSARGCARCVFREVCPAYAETAGPLPETMASQR